MRKILVTVAITAVIVLTACSNPPSTATTQQETNTYIDPGYIKIKGIPGNSVYKFYDMEEGVVCYINDGYYSGGIHCMPTKAEWQGLDKPETVE